MATMLYRQHRHSHDIGGGKQRVGARKPPEIDGFDAGASTLGVLDGAGGQVSSVTWSAAVL
jgi:hypothetical protein